MSALGSVEAEMRAAARRLDGRGPLDGDLEIWHTGATNRFASYAGFVPSRHVGVVVLVNRGLSPWGALVANPVERAARRLLRACVRASA